MLAQGQDCSIAAYSIRYSLGIIAAELNGMLRSINSCAAGQSASAARFSSGQCPDTRVIETIYLNHSPPDAICASAQLLSAR